MAKKAAAKPPDDAAVQSAAATTPEETKVTAAEAPAEKAAAKKTPAKRTTAKASSTAKKTTAKKTAAKKSASMAKTQKAAEAKAPADDRSAASVAPEAVEAAEVSAETVTEAAPETAEASVETMTEAAPEAAEASVETMTEAAPKTPEAPAAVEAEAAPEAAEASVETMTEAAPEAAEVPAETTREPAEQEGGSDDMPKMFILHAASEAQPFIKTGGLADVLASLPKEQAAQGNRVAVILPKYRDIPYHFVERMQYLTNFTVQLGWRTQYCGVFSLEYDGVTYYFVDNEFYFGFSGVYTEMGPFEAERYSFFCRAVLEVIGHLNLFPDVLHCHDWQSGMIPFLLRAQYSFNPAYARIRCVYTIHNLKFQGVFSWPLVEGMLFIDARYNNPECLEFNHDINFMKGGIVFSDLVTTVSPTYSYEIQTGFFGENLDGLLRSRAQKLFGVVNGLDMQEYNPQLDGLIPAHFSVDDLSGKAECKRSLQHEMWLHERPDVPLIGMVSRLTSQKGLDLVRCVLTDLMDHNDIQMAILGTGEREYEDFFRWASSAYPGRIAAHIELNYPLSHRIYAGCDFFLMPSLFEPCGLSQMMSMRYGTLPIVRKTGGLADTVDPYNEYEVTGNGYAFNNYNAHEMMGTIEYALRVYHERPDHHVTLMHNAMTRDFSWTLSARRYSELYASIQR